MVSVSYTHLIHRCRYGHGVGLSQRGAQQMGSEGYNYQQILNFYYPNATLGTIDLKSMSQLQGESSGNTGTNPTPTPTQTPGTPSDQYFKAVTTGSVNFRKGAGTHYESCLLYTSRCV